jgi:hypothetical protein
MSNFEKCMNDPDIMNEPMALREIHAIRFMLHEETKHLTPEEKTARTQKIASGIMEKHGLMHLRVASSNRE